jgi:hypothetical protein
VQRACRAEPTRVLASKLKTLSSPVAVRQTDSERAAETKKPLRAGGAFDERGSRRKAQPPRRLREVARKIDVTAAWISGEVAS